MAGGRALLLLGCLLLLSSAQQVAAGGYKFGNSPYECLTKLGLTKLKAIIDAVGMKSYFSTSYTTNTLFAASNAAVDSFYAALQLNETDALKDKYLMKRVLQYNMAPYGRQTWYWPTFQNGFKKQKTLIPAMMLKLYSTATERKVAEGFENKAVVSIKPDTYNLICGMSVVHMTNAVLIPITLKT